MVTTSLGLPTRFIPHASTPEEILGGLGLDAPGIAAAVRRALERKSTARPLELAQRLGR